MPTAIDSLDTLALELARQLREIIAAAPAGRTISLPRIGMTIEVGAAEGDTVRVGILAPRDAVIRRQGTEPPSALPDYSGIPEIDMEAFARHAKEHPFTPTQEMIDEDWSHLIPKKDG